MLQKYGKNILEMFFEYMHPGAAVIKLIKVVIYE
jgi:hypothetical protein